MNWSATKGRFVVLASLFVLAWYVSVLLNTNAGWGWGDPEYSAPWIGRSLAIWVPAIGAAAVIAASVWRPYRWTIFAPALVAAIGLLTRRLYPIGSPPDFFLHDQASARWVAAALFLLQLLALALSVVPPLRGRAENRYSP
jgi:hypothetical protein